MPDTEENQIVEQAPEVLDADTLAAIDKAKRWTPITPAISFDEALKNARARHRAWQNA